MRAVVYEGPRQDNGGECVGHRAHEPDGREQADLTMNRPVASVRSTGRIGTVGVVVPQDPGAQDDLARQGELAFDGWTTVVLHPAGG